MAYEIVVLTNMAIAVLFALSLNVITGFCGQVSLGHAAFLGIGAYTSAMLSKAGVPIVITFVPAMGMAAVSTAITARVTRHTSSVHVSASVAAT